MTSPLFLPSCQQNQSNVTGDGTTYTIICNTEITDQGSNYNNSTGVFTAPFIDTYLLGAQIRLDDLDTDTYEELDASIVTLNRNYLIAQSSGLCYATGGLLTLVGTTLADMDAGDTASMAVTVTGGTKTVDVLSTQTVFYGTLIC